MRDTHREELALAHGQRRTRRHRTIFTEDQLEALEQLFMQNQYPDVHTRERLAQRAHLREERVEVSLSRWNLDQWDLDSCDPIPSSNII